MSNNQSPRMKRLGRVLYWLAWVLGVAELGIMSRAGEWLDYRDIGTLGSLYFLGLLSGVLIAPRLPLPSAGVIALSVLVAALPIVGIGLILAGVVSADTFTAICVLWTISGLGAGMLDNAQSAQATRYSTRGRTDSVAMLGVRHLGTLSASGATAVAVSGGIDVGWHYVVLGAILILPIAGARHVPDLPHTEAAAGRRGTRSAGILLPMAVFLAASVLPISASWAYINPIMLEELRAPGFWGASALSAFVVAQALACFVYFRRSAKRDVSRLVRGGLFVAALGVVALVAVSAHGELQLLPAGSPHVLAWCGFALLGWGVAPLPMVVAQAVGALPLRLRLTTRLSIVVALQCLLVAGGNYVLGAVAESWSGPNAFAAMSVLCVALLFVGIGLIGRRTGGR